MKNGILAMAAVGVLLVSALLLVAPPASAQVGSKTIAVDGNPGDWTGVNPNPDTGVESNGEYVWNDGTGDDTGDGDYTYPKAGDLNRTGLFDLTAVHITADATNLYVLLRILNLSNAWGGSDGFSTVAGILLIDTTRDGSGQLAAKPNVNVAAGGGWEYWARLGNPGWHVEAKKVFDAQERWAPIENKGDPANNAIEFSIPLAFIGKDGYDIDGATWRFMFFLQSHDGGGPNGFRDVRLEPWGEDWMFGGGANHSFDPQIMDLAFSASRAAQEAELNSYTASTAATIGSWADVTFANTIGFTPDVTGPQITGVGTTPTFNRATVSWTTNELANGTVLYGIASGQLNQQAPQPGFMTSHTVTISGLAAQRTYYYKIVAWDIAGNRAETAEATFATTAAPPSNIASWVGPMFVWEDQWGDDVGDGDYVYPLESTIPWAGKADLTWVNMTRTATQLHMNVKVNAVADTIWHQRMASVAIFIDQDRVYDSGARSVALVGNEADETVANQHPLNVSVAPNFAFEYLIVANFQNGTDAGRTDPTGEMLVFNNTWKGTENRWSLMYLSTAPSLSAEPATGTIFARNGNEADLWLNLSVFGTTDNWVFVMAAMLYDDAARPFQEGGIRSVKTAAENWAGGGANAGFWNPNIYDLAFYPDTANQTADLSDYATGRYANLTRGVRINFGAQQHALVHATPLTHDYAVTVAASPNALDEGEEATVTVTVTDNGAPLSGAQVSLAYAPTAAGSIVGAQVKTTNASGKATFTFRAGAVTQDTTVTFTATATNDTATKTGTGTLTVNGPAPPPPSGIDPLLIAGAVILLILIVVALVLLMRRKKPAVSPEETKEEAPKT